MAKHSTTIAGHRTSISLEQPFWQAVGDIAVTMNCSRAALIEVIDRNRTPDSNLSSAIRLFVLDWYRSGRGSGPLSTNSRDSDRPSG